MSRSRKKVPGFSCNYARKERIVYLRAANRAIRRFDPFSEKTWLKDGGSYRKLVPFWFLHGGPCVRYFSKTRLDREPGWPGFKRYQVKGK